MKIRFVLAAWSFMTAITLVAAPPVVALGIAVGGGIGVVLCWVHERLESQQRRRDWDARLEAQRLNTQREWEERLERNRQVQDAYAVQEKQGWADFLIGDAPEPPKPYRKPSRLDGFCDAGPLESVFDGLAAQWLAQCKAEGLDVIRDAAGQQHGVLQHLPNSPIRVNTAVEALRRLHHGLVLMNLCTSDDEHNRGSDYFARRRAQEQAAALSEAMSAAVVAAPVKRGRL